MKPDHTESTGVAGGGLSQPRAKRPIKAWLGLALAISVGAMTWLVVPRQKTPQQQTENEVRRILSSVRWRDRSGFNILSILDAMQGWPRPFPRLAMMLAGPDSPDEMPANSLAALGPLAVPILTNALARDRAPAVRSVAAEALGEMRDTRLVPQLIGRFGTERDPDVQSSILQALGGVGDEQAEPLLISVMLGTNAQPVRIASVRALGMFQSSRAITALTNALATSTNNQVRQWVVMFDLPWTAQPAAKPALLSALHSDPDASVRRSAVKLLAQHPGDDTVVALITTLREDTDNLSVRPGAINTLREMTNAMIRPALLEALQQDVQEVVRAAAATGLETFPGPETEAALLRALASDPATGVRSAAAAAIGYIASTQTNRALLPELIRCLHHDPDPETRAAAASALNRVGGNEVVKALRTALETERKGRVQAEAIGGLYQHSSSESTDLLMQLLDGGNLEPEAVAEAVRCLGYARVQTTTRRLARLLAESPEEAVRTAAAAALGALDNTNAAAALVCALGKDTAGFVRTEVATALGGMTSAAGPAAVSALVRALGTDKENSVRAATATALGSRRDPAALPVLLKVLQRDVDRETRANAATALGKLGRAGAIEQLKSAFQRDRDRQVRANAAHSIAVLAGAEQGRFLLASFDSNPLLRPELASILGQIGSPESVAALLSSLKEDGWSGRAAVVQALGDAGDSSAVPGLIVFLGNDREPTTRAATATALGRLCNPDAVPALEAVMRDRVLTVRQEAAWALGHIGDVRAAPTLTQALSDRDSEVRFAAAFALAEMGARSAVPALTPLLRHADDRTRLAAASALAFLDDPAGVKVLSDTLNSKDVWQRFTALISMLRLDAVETRQLLADRHDADPTLAAVIAGGLRLGGAGAATNMLCTARDDDSMTQDFRHFGARALVLFNEPATLPALRANANDPREEVRAAVRVAIRRLEKKTAGDKPRTPAR